MRRLMIPMSAEVVLELMKRSRRSGLPISELVVQAIEAWLGTSDEFIGRSEQEANGSKGEKLKDSKHLRGKARY